MKKAKWSDQTQLQEPSNWASLPADIARNIFSRLYDYPVVIKLVCKRWSRLMDEQTWEMISRRKWPSLELLTVRPETVAPKLVKDNNDSEPEESDEDKTEAPHKINPSFWQQLYRDRYKRIRGHGVSQIMTACINFAEDPNNKHFGELKDAMQNAQMWTKLGGLLSDRVENKEEQFFLDSVVYTHLNISHEGDKDYYEVLYTTTEVGGTIMSLNGCVLHFRFVDNWRNPHGEAWDSDEDNMIIIADAGLSLSTRWSVDDYFKKWLIGAINPHSPLFDFPSPWKGVTRGAMIPRIGESSGTR